MRKFFLVAILAAFTVASQAQIVSSRSSRITKKEAVNSHWFLDLGAGAYGDGVDGSSVNIDLGIRWSHMFTPNIGWDILKANVQTDASNFTEALNIQGKSGIRGVSPVVFGNSTLYANAGFGYGYFTDMEAGGFVWEIGAGINFNPRLSLGIVYNSNKFSKDEEYYGYGYEGDVSIKGKVNVIQLRLSVGL